MAEAKYNFIINCSDEDLQKHQDLNIQDAPEKIVGASLEWTLQTYLILKERGNLSVLCSNCFMQDSINIIHSDDLIRLRGSSKDYIVCIKGEFPWRRWAHYHIVQNKKEIKTQTSYIPLWIQPGLKKRNFNRTKVERIAYAGQTWNGNLAATAKAWEDLFRPYGVEFVTLNTGNCYDLSNIDVLIGIRSFDTKGYNSKPPSKLVNAWHAHIPFVGGYDSAFSQVGIPGEDYMLAQTANEVLNAVIFLRDNKYFYQSIVNNGIKRTNQINNETIAKQWEEVLSGPVISRHFTWQKRNNYERARFFLTAKSATFKHRSKQFIKQLLKSD
jgi:hypothetical protein